MALSCEASQSHFMLGLAMIIGLLYVSLMPQVVDYVHDSGGLLVILLY